MIHAKVKQWFKVLITLTGLLLVVGMVALVTGSAGIEIRQIPHILSQGSTSPEYSILMHIRLPRILLGMAIGGALSLAGTLLQGMFRNPLVEPYTLGISGGALGTMFVASVLVAGLGLAGGLIFVTGVDPLSLWNPAGLTQVDQWFNFQTYPLNLLYILGGGILSLGFLGSWAVARAVRNAESRHQMAIQLLDQLAALRLDQENAWQQ